MISESYVKTGGDPNKYEAKHRVLAALFSVVVTGLPLYTDFLTLSFTCKVNKVNIEPGLSVYQYIS